MAFPPDSLAMMADIDMDYEEALHHFHLSDQGFKTWRDVTYAVERGFRPLMLDVAVPKGKGPFPLVVFIHGGAWFVGHPTISNPKYRKLDLHKKLIKAGFAVARIAYRFSSEGKFPMQLHDCKAAIRFLRKHADNFTVDPTRFAVMGDSAGGHLAAMVGVTNNNAVMEGTVGVVEGSSAVQAVVDWFGPVNFLTMEADARAAKVNWPSHDLADAPEAFLVGGPVQERQTEVLAASPLSYVTSAAPPFLFQHGTKDRMVPFAQSQALSDKLQAAGCDVTLKPIVGADHCFWGVSEQGIVEDVIAFLRAKL
jgi:acetyl esterase/lipase